MGDRSIYVCSLDAQTASTQSTSVVVLSRGRHPVYYRCDPQFAGVWLRLSLMGWTKGELDNHRDRPLYAHVIGWTVNARGNEHARPSSRHDDRGDSDRSAECTCLKFTNQEQASDAAH